MDKVAVVILNYNTADLLQTLLPHLEASTYANLELIVADNGSSDSSEEVVKSFAKVTWLALDQNYGYAEGYNQALKNLDCKYAVLLNSDVEVTPGWIEPLVEYGQTHPEYVALQPKIKSYNQRTHFEYAGAAGGFMDALGYPFCRGRIFDTLEEDLGQYDTPLDIFWASGAALFIQLEAYHLAGGLDGKLFAHMEEIDLCWRLQLMGKKIACVPESVVYHIGGGTLSAQNAKKTYLNFRNSLVLLARYNSGITGFFKVLLRMMLDFPAALLFLTKGRIKDVWAIVKAHWNFIFRLNYWRKKKDFPNQNAQASGVISSSMVWLHYAKGVKKFSDLK